MGTQTTTGKSTRILYVCILTLVLLALLDFSYRYDETHSYAARNAAEAALAAGGTSS